MRVIIEYEYLIKLYSTGKNAGKPKFNREIEQGFIKRIIQIEQAQTLNNLRDLKPLHLEKLSGNLEGKYSIRVNLSYRIIFRVEKDENSTSIHIIYVEELNNHYS